MKKIYIIGNWKSNKTIDEALDWLIKFNQLVKGGRVIPTHLEVILCLPFIHLYPLKQAMVNGLIKLASQDVSPFPDGAYSGAVSAGMLKGLVDYSLVGHSERRQYFAETDKIIAQKVKQLNQVGIKPILCVQGAETPIPKGVKLIAYEPVWAIGTAKPATAKHANSVAAKIKKKQKKAIIIYGGSVTPENVASFIKQPNISGVLPGGISLHPTIFFQLITNAY